MRKKIESGLRSTRRAMGLVLETDRRLTIAMALLALVSGVLPGVIAWVGKQIVDGVVSAFLTDLQAARDAVVIWVAVELALVVVQRAIERGQWLAVSLLRTRLGQHINERILEKALTLSLPSFEDPETYDRMTRARRGASYRPLSLVTELFNMARTTVALAVYGLLLWQLAPWALLLVVVAAVPVFIADTRFSKDSFRLFSWRAPESRRQNYLESVLARAEHQKEVKLFALGPLLLERYRAIFQAHYDEDRARTVKQALRGYLLGLLSTFAFYGTYAWIVLRTARGEISFGDMAMYLLVFRSAQGALGSMLGHVQIAYEHHLYAKELFSFLDHESEHEPTDGAHEGPDPQDGLRFESVSFRYPDADQDVLRSVDLHIRPGHKLALVGENGAGKTTLIKLMTGLYRPTEGRVLLDGLDLTEWDPARLRRRIGVIFQDFVRYQFLVGENIGVGDVDAIDDEARWVEAAKKGMAHEMIEGLPDGYQTQLGRWFDDGRELSGGQWQKIALARAFMRVDADILVLDEPTASMDALAEMRVFERFRALAADRMAILISHRFSTVRMADTIAVLHRGEITERGTHQELLDEGGRYAELFLTQAKGYR